MTTTQQTATTADIAFMVERHAMFLGYEPKTDTARERVERLRASGLVQQTPQGRYTLTAEGAATVSR